MPEMCLSKKGHKFERVYTAYDSDSKKDYKNKRKYVSDDANSYLDDYFVDDYSKVRIQEIQANKKLLFAGEESVNKVLKDIGEKPLNKVYDDKGNLSKDYSGTDRDFLMKDNEIADKFIKRAIEKGYAGIRDPVDDTGLGFSPSARILFDPNAYSIVKDYSLYDTRDAEKLVEKMIKANRSIGPI